MSCYNPILGIPDVELNENGKRQYQILGKYTPELSRMHPGAIPIPCGKCIGCRLDYSRSWADRMMLELDHTKKAIFVTLTYNNDHVPFTEDSETNEFGCFSLYRRDLQLFFKRLRKKFDTDIRYYACGEYGEHTQRPHYHAIIFGLGLEDFPDRKPIGKNELGNVHYDSKELDKVWSIYHRKKKDSPAWYEPIGFTVLAEASWKSMAYCARYVQKKIFAVKNLYQEIYDAEPEFSVMSRNPGIGAYFYKDHPEFMMYSNIWIPGKENEIKIPKYNLKQIEALDKEKYYAIIEDRKQFAKDSVFQKMLQTDLQYAEQLEIEENKKLWTNTALKRLL